MHAVNAHLWYLNYLVSDLNFSRFLRVLHQLLLLLDLPQPRLHLCHDGEVDHHQAMCTLLSRTSLFLLWLPALAVGDVRYLRLRQYSLQ
jgi:hypothetical protein